MGLDFISRSLKTSGVVLLIFLPFGLYYLGVYNTLAIFSGAVWGIVNLLFITRLIKVTIRPDGVNSFQAIGLSLIKFPLLYLAGYFLLKIPHFEPLYLVIGFTSILAIITLKVMGKALIDSDSQKQNNGRLQKVL